MAVAPVDALISPQIHRVFGVPANGGLRPDPTGSEHWKPRRSEVKTASKNRQRLRRETTMRHATGYLAVLALVLAPVATRAADTQKFDGDWQTTVSCAAARDALGYSFRFISTVKNATFHGVHGTVGEPSSLQIDGKIAPDGTANLYASGRTGSKEMVPGRDTPRGTEYSYSLSAHFEGSTGTGIRIEGRPCTFQFAKL